MKHYNIIRMNRHMTVWRDINEKRLQKNASCGVAHDTHWGCIKCCDILPL